METLRQIDEATRDLDIDERADLIQKLFGDEGKVGLIPLLQRLDLFGESVEELGRLPRGFVEKEYSRFARSAAGQWKALRAQTTLAGDAMATTVLPQVVSLAGSVARMAGARADAAERWPWLGKVIGVAVAGIVGLTVGVAALNAGLSPTGGTVCPFRSVQCAKNVAWGVNELCVAGPNESGNG